GGAAGPAVALTAAGTSGGGAGLLSKSTAAPALGMGAAGALCTATTEIVWALAIPTKTGSVATPVPARASNSFRAKPSSSGIPFAMMSSILLFRLEPVTRETTVDGRDR